MANHQPASGLLVDAAGKQHTVAGSYARIVSLVPSITELLFELNLGSAVVGRTTFCVRPREQVEAVPRVGGTKQVKIEKIRALSPTHVVVNVDETPKALAEQLSQMGYEIVVTHPIDVRDNLALYRLVGALFDRRVQAEELCARFQTAYRRLVESQSWPLRRVLYLIWKDPWMTVSADTYISRMLALVNWHTIPTAAQIRYPAIELNEALANECDLVLFSSEPFSFTDRHLVAFATQFPAQASKALQVDGQMVSWYGSRAIEGLDYLGALARAST